MVIYKNSNPKTCYFCKRKVKKLYSHHIIPKVKGGLYGNIIKCCKTCSQQIHMLFSTSELKNMALSDLESNHKWIEYLNWISKREGEYSVKLSARIKRKKRK